VPSSAQGAAGSSGDRRIAETDGSLMTHGCTDCLQLLFLVCFQLCFIRC
jgi:hypothetical protein